MRPLVLLLSFAFPAVAAPVPKALKKPPPSPTDGVWEWVEFNGMNGTLLYTIPTPTYWRIEGERISTGQPSVEELFREKLPHTFRIRDERQPHLRGFSSEEGVEHSAVVQVDGDTLRWCYAIDPTVSITECKPAKGVYYYVFQRVKDK